MPALLQQQTAVSSGTFNANVALWRPLRPHHSVVIPLAILGWCLFARQLATWANLVYIVHSVLRVRMGWSGWVDSVLDSSTVTAVCSLFDTTAQPMSCSAVQDIVTSLLRVQ